MSSEFEIIRHYFSRPALNAVLGIGDDAAIVDVSPGKELIISTDTLVSGQHFFVNTDPFKLGHKALAVNLSDMAAMGATPRWATLAITLPKALIENNESWLDAFAKGFFNLANEHYIELIGGDTTCGPLTISVQIIGEADKGNALRRSNAKVGDDIWISGYLGDAALALAHEQQRIELQPEAVKKCMPALLTPTPRIALGQSLINLAHSAIDISDGLLSDLGHILDSSAVGATIKMNAIACSSVLANYLPQTFAVSCILSGGDDYELCFTVPKINREKIKNLSIELSIPLTRIGKVTNDKGLTVLDQNGNIFSPETKGYDHFYT